MKTLALAILGVLLGASPAVEAERTLKIRNALPEGWKNQLLSEPLSFAAGECRGELRLEDAAGRLVPVQLSGVSRHADGSLASATAWFLLAEIGPESELDLKLKWGTGGPTSPAPGVTIRKSAEGLAEILTSQLGVRIPLGEQRFEQPVDASSVPGPLQAVRLAGGAWTGKGWFKTPRRCTGWRSAVVDEGPVFVEVVARYAFEKPEGWAREGGLFYEARLRVVAGLPLVYVTEDYNLGDPKVYQAPRYRDEQDEMTWNWWSWRPHEAADNFCFSVTSEAFAPTHARAIVHNVTSPTRGDAKRSYDAETIQTIPFQEDRVEFTVDARGGNQPDQSVLYTMYRADDPASEILSVMPLHPGRWRNPDMLPHEPAFIRQHTNTTALRIHSTRAKDLIVTCPLNLGHREWALGVLKNPGVVTEQREFTTISTLLSRTGLYPFDVVRRWVLEWPDAHAYAEREPARDSAEEKRHRETHQRLQGRLREALTWPSGNERTNINSFPPGVANDVRAVRELLESGKLTAAQGRRLRVLASFFVHLLRHDDYFPPRKAGFAWGSSNMPISVARGRLASAAQLKDHPSRAAWLDYSRREIRHVLNKSFGPDGSPESNPHYMGILVDSAIEAVTALRDAGVIDDPVKAFPNVHRAGRFLVDMMPPKDVRLGVRTVPPIGDGYWERNEPALKLAPIFAEHDPELAANLAWAAQSTGLRPRSLEPREPRWSSVAYPGWGAFLRSGGGSEHESYLGVRFGNFTLDHTHNDAGSINWYARGVPLSMDFATMYTPHSEAAWLHSTLTFDHHEKDALEPCSNPGGPGCLYHGTSFYEHKLEPHWYLSPKPSSRADNFTELHGTIAAFATQSGADYVRGQADRSSFEKKPYYRHGEGTPSPWSGFSTFQKVELASPLLWTRQFAFVKDSDPKKPSYLVIADDLAGNRELSPATNFWCLSKSVSQVSPRHWRFAGQHGVDLDLFSLAPSDVRFQTGRWGHKQGFLVGEKGLQETQDLVRIHGGKGAERFLAVHYPRLSDEPVPAVEAVGGGSLVRVTLPDQVHWVLLSPKEVEVADGPVKMRGTAAIAKRWSDGRVEVTLLAKGAVSCDGVELAGDQPGTKTR